MSEPPQRPPDHRDDAGDGLLATKLYTPPPVGAGFVARPRLVASLDEQVKQGIVLVSAPAGFGKTSLLAEWVCDRDEPVAWLSLDSGDNDPVRFWRHVAAAIDRALPGIPSEIGPIGPGTPHSLEAWLTALINELATEPNDEVVLILDDYHVTHTSGPDRRTRSLFSARSVPNDRDARSAADATAEHLCDERHVDEPGQGRS